MRRSFVIVLLLILSSACLTAADEAPQSAFERQLDSLARGPIVAALDVRGQPKNSNPQTLEELAGSYDLVVLTQDGISVLGTEQRVDFAALISSDYGIHPYPDDLPTDLIVSLSDQQLRALGSPAGLAFSVLSQSQKEIISSIFCSENELTKSPHYHSAPMPAGPPDDDEIAALSEEPATPASETMPAIPASRIPLNSITLNACLETENVDVYSQVGGWSTAYFEWPFEEQWSVSGVTIDNPEEYHGKPPPLVDNTLKPSDLDYDRKELSKPISISGRSLLGDLIKRIAQDSGLPLLASTGTDDISLWIRVKDLPEGSLLKAVSLANQASWRRLGNVYLFVPDLIGFDQVTARQNQLELLDFVRLDQVQDNLRNITTIKRIAANISVNPVDPFKPSLAQINIMLKRLQDSGSGCLMPNEMTVPQARALGRDAENVLKVEPSISINLTYRVPGFEPIGYDSGLTLIPPEADDLMGEDWGRSASPGLSIQVKSPVRGLLLKPAKADTPEAVVALMEKYGLNTLYLRVFADGYTLFQSGQFPARPWLGKSDYLAKIIAAAHQKQIKVVGVIDVLRWSDGSADHWLLRKPELLDYTINGETQSEWFRSHALAKEEAVWVPYVFGDALEGDAVTPFNPLVAEKLKAMLGELARYPLDGLAFDHTVTWDAGYAFIGQMGYAEVARREFVRKYGVDPVDVNRHPAWLIEVDLRRRNLPPLASRILELGMEDEVGKFYRSACDDLLHSLALEWNRLNKGNLPSVIDTFGDGPGFDGETRISHDWSRLNGQIGRVISMSSLPESEYPGHGIRRMALLRAADGMGTLLFAKLLAATQKPDTELPHENDETHVSGGENAIILDLTGLTEGKNDYLRIIEPPKSGTNTGEKSP